MNIFTNLLFFSLFIFTTIAQSDTLKPGHSIKDGQTLVSAGNVFELGFFSPGTSTSRYVGIWYQNSNTTQIWVANRESPLTDTSGSLSLTSDGNLAVLNSTNHLIWSTNSSTVSSNTTAQLTDSGNLIIIDGATGTTVSWQSYDHPADTFVPGMKISRPAQPPNSSKNRILTSWRSPEDPSPGNYSLGLDTRGSAQFFIWENGVPRWRSGQWNGVTFIGTVIRPLYVYGFKPVTDSDGVIYFTFTPFNSSLLRFVMQWDGWEKTSMMVGDGWETVWQQPLNECDVYGKCGDHGVCVYNGGVSCHCLRGFEPKARQDWKNENWSGGCVRTTPLHCTSQSNNTGDGFFPVEGVKLPDLSFWASTVESEDGCQSACANNCSCEAYAYPTGIGCLIWGRELIDIYQFSQGGNTLYLKLPDSDLGTGAEKWKLYVVIATIGVAALILCFVIWWKCSAGIKNCWKKGGKGESSRASMFSRLEGKRDFSGPSESGEGQEGASSELPFYKFSQISAATSKFSDSNKLGQGGFGHVYRGILPGGEQIAVKRLSASSGQGLEEFKNEVILIAKLQHRNLVRLLGCCIEGEEKILIYEYMPNKSLDAFLFEPTKKELLDWRIRFSIIEGVARGLLYLHRDSRLRIIHRDLKASNILLDEHMNPKISDFGMARIFGGDQNQANTNRVVGTYGYMSPEYAMEGLFSVKSDVYSFGVLVLEIVMSRRNSNFNRILGYAWQCWSEDRAMELIDQSIRDSCSIDQVLRCIHVALLCVQDHNTERPDMAAVVFMLGSETATFPVPNQPKFTMGDVPNRVVVNEYESFSASDVTITAVQGR